MTFAYKIDRDTTAAGAYPIMLVSYAIACTQYADAGEGRELVKAYLTYVVSAEGQAAAAQARRAPRRSPTRCVTQITPAIAAITAADEADHASVAEGPGVRDGRRGPRRPLSTMTSRDRWHGPRPHRHRGADLPIRATAAR